MKKSMFNLLKNTWPVIFIIILLAVRNVFLKYLTTNINFYDTIISTLIGVLLAFWLDYLFTLLIQKKVDKKKLVRLLVLLKTEVYSNKQALKQISEAISSAIKAGLIQEVTVTASISEASNGIRHNSFYAMQSSGWLEVVENEKLFTEIITAYQKSNIIENVIKFAGTQTQEYKFIGRDRRNQIEMYEGIVKSCDEVVPMFETTIKSLDDELKKMGLLVKIES